MNKISSPIITILTHYYGINSIRLDGAAAAGKRNNYRLINFANYRGGGLINRSYLVEFGGVADV